MPVLEILIVLALVLLNGYFALSELAVVSARPARLEALARQGRRGARLALTLARAPSRMLSTVQIGITLVGIVAGAFGAARLAEPLHQALAGLPVAVEYVGAALAEAAAVVGSAQIRNRATIGGNMANATPSADVAPSLIALNATAKIVSTSGERTVPMEEFFRGPGQNAMNADEILTEITIPRTGPQLAGEYIKFSPRDMMDLAYIGVAVAYNLANDKKCSGVRIVLGAVAPTPIRAKNSEALLEGKVLTEELATQVGDEAARESKPISDVRSSADYRRAMVAVMTKRAILNAAVGPAKSWVDRRDRRY